MKSRRIIITLLVAVFSAIALYKLILLDYTPATILPETGYSVNIRMSAVGHGGEINTKVLLPISNPRQTIFDENSQTGNFNFLINRAGLNRFGVWQSPRIKGEQEYSYSFDVKVKEAIYNLPEKLHNNYKKSKKFTTYLDATPLIQVNSPEIKSVLSQLGLNQETNVITSIKKIYKYVTYKIENAGFSGKTDAITSLKLEQASCNGKTRLFAAMLRTLGIPARLTGGLILNVGEKKISHQWVEVLLGREWVPFDPTNRHFADLPSNYLTFYYGDLPFFQRTPNVNFKYTFEIDRKSFPRETNYSGLASHSFNIMNAWGLFNKAGLSMELLQIILMIPVGAIVTIIFRNVIGIRTFGTFLPALIASSFRGPGLLWGMITFTSIIIGGTLIRALLEKLKLTHTPKLTVLLVYVVFSLLFVAGFGVKMNNLDLAHATFFPLALTAITIERFSIMAQEGTLKDAFKILLNTMVTVLVIYIVINSLFLQTFVMAFPETMLLVIAAGIYFGSWVGLRLNEMIRFRGLLFGKMEA